MIHIASILLFCRVNKVGQSLSIADNIGSRRKWPIEGGVYHKEVYIYIVRFPSYQSNLQREFDRILVEV